MIDTWYNEDDESGGSTGDLFHRKRDMSPCVGTAAARLPLRMRGSDSSQLFDCDVDDLAIIAD